MKKGVYIGQTDQGSDSIRFALYGNKLHIVYGSQLSRHNIKNNGFRNLSATY